jgi:hypothetical protein
MKNTAIAVAPSIPPITPVPIEWRLFCEAPSAMASGTQPRMNASEVITIGRRRSVAAVSAASYGVLPSSRFSTANSKIRIAFFAASATSMVSPIWKYTSLFRPRSRIASSAPNRANGTAMSTPNGSDHFSYCAARIRNTMMIPNTNTRLPVEPDLISSNASPLHPMA